MAEVNSAVAAGHASFIGGIAEGFPFEGNRVGGRDSRLDP